MVARGVSDALLSATYRGARVLVTGHTGFKGAWLTMWLADLGAEVFGYALPPTSPSAFEAAAVSDVCRHEVGDVCDLARVAAAVERAKPDFVFHLAAQSLVSEGYAAPAATFATNVMGTVNVLEAVRSVGRPTHVVVVTSDKCYESREWVHGYREDDPLGGHDPYSASKGAAELAVAAYRRSFFSPDEHGRHGVALASARAGNVLGGGDFAPQRLVPDLVRALLKSEAAVVRNPTAVRPWQHVLEALGGYLLLGARLKASPSKHATAYNFGPALEATLSAGELASAFVEAWGGGHWEPAAAPPLGARHETQQLRLAIDKAHAELGFRPRWELGATLAATVDWYRAHARGVSAKDLRSISLAQARAYAGAT